MKRRCELGVVQAWDCRCAECLLVAGIMDADIWKRVLEHRRFASLKAIEQSCANWFREQIDARPGVTRHDPPVSLRTAEGIYTTPIDSFAAPATLPLCDLPGAVRLVLRRWVEAEPEDSRRPERWITEQPAWRRLLAAPPPSAPFAHAYGAGYARQYRERQYRRALREQALPAAPGIVRYLWHCTAPEEYLCLCAEPPSPPKPALRLTSFLIAAGPLDEGPRPAVFARAQMLHDFSAHSVGLTEKLTQQARRAASEHLQWWEQSALRLLAKPTLAVPPRQGARTGKYADMCAQFAAGQLTADQLREAGEMRLRQDQRGRLDADDRREVLRDLCDQLGRLGPELEVRFRAEITRRARRPRA